MDAAQDGAEKAVLEAAAEGVALLDSAANGVPNEGLDSDAVATLLGGRFR